ncbi:MAG: FAD-dependent oxidoreductase [Cyanobacteriota bacterium]|nr:FAD-dependent oxidoreductase [Cyanobacteriota bacterium]
MSPTPPPAPGCRRRQPGGDQQPSPANLIDAKRPRRLTRSRTRCGYSAPAQGEVTRVFPNLERGWKDKLFFAGEYASPGFYGYMEGGLNSGAVLARRLARQFQLVAAG